MFRSLKYQNSTVREHLASQYAMGLLSSQVKKRTEALMKHDGGFEKSVVEWQERLAPLNSLSEPVSAPVDLKQRVINSIQTTQTAPAGLIEQLRQWCKSAFLWQGVAFASVAAMVMLIAFPLTSPQLAKGGLAYIAVMESQNVSAEAPLVISAYSKTEEEASRLELRWNDRTPDQGINAATLWAVERETGNVMLLSKLDAGTQRISLTAEKWKAVQSSLELVVTAGDDFNSAVLLRGTCLQLASWAA